MKYLKTIFFILVFFSISNSAFSTEVYFVDMKKLLNGSKAGKEAQSYLMKRFQSENKKFEKEAFVKKSKY